jgi:hypothetical protein
MDANNVLSELERAMSLLQSGWRIYVIEDKPYPVPHRVVLVKDYRQEEIGYNTFVSLVTQQRIRQIGQTSISGMPAEEWTMVG